jgi:integrase
MANKQIEDKDIEAWLSECRTASTKNSYIYGSNLFFNWLQKEKNVSLEQFKALTPKEIKTLLLQFQNSEPKGEGRIYKSKHRHRDTKSNIRIVEPKPLRKNAINTVLTAIQSFCIYLEKPLLLKGKRVGVEDDTHSHYFSNGDLGTMYDVCDWKGKAIIATACSLGWEVSDFLGLDRGMVEAHIKRAESEGKEYIYFPQTRTKTNVPRLAVLNPLAIKSLKEWLAINPTKTLFDMTKSGITKFMKATAKKANINTTGTVRFHRIRAWTFNSLIKAGFSELEAKYIVGKAIPHSDGTYLRLQEGIEQKYPKLYNEYLNIKPEKIQMIDEDLKKSVEELKKETDSWLKAVMHTQEFQDEVKDFIQKQIPDAIIREVFYETLFGSETLVIQVRGYLNGEGNYKEFQGRILKKINV